MEGIILIKGNVKFSITLDPGVWIFDDRRVDLDTFFSSQQDTENELEQYTKEISKHWDREIMEGAIMPKTLKTERKFEKEKVLSGSFAVPFEPFLKNAEPSEDAKKVNVETETGNIELSIDKAKDLLLAFSKKGKPLLEDGPVHIYFKDGSNQNEPIKNVKSFIVK